MWHLMHRQVAMTTMSLRWHPCRRDCEIGNLLRQFRVIFFCHDTPLATGGQHPITKRLQLGGVRQLIPR